MPTSLRWTSADLEVMPEDGKRYEIIDGELYVSRQPNWIHQAVCGDFFLILQTWSDRTGLGRALFTPGLVFADDDNVAPDVVWISKGRLVEAIDPSGHLRLPPELVVEVLAPGMANERRDLEVKLKLCAFIDASARLSSSRQRWEPPTFYPPYCCRAFPPR
jgi:Uma2 family endonuclease